MSKSLLIAAQRARFVSFLLLALLLGQAVAARASELLVTKDFADVAKAVEGYVAKFGAEHVLLVLDIDNTIMSMDTDLGSDHWFEWQSYLLGNEKDSPHLVAKDFPGLLEVQGILFDRGKMHPTQPEEPALIAKLQKLGVSTLVLTSRGLDYKDQTQRELARCGYDFKASALPVKDLPAGPFLPYDPAKPEESGLSAEDLEKYKPVPPRPSLYVDGVFMTAGQHKGLMLLTMRKKSLRDIKAVVYLDDNVRHVGSVFSAAVAHGLETTVFQFQHDETRVQRFQYSDKADMDAEWAAIKNGGKAVAAAKPQGEKPSLQAESSTAEPSDCRECIPKRRLRILHLCR